MGTMGDTESDFPETSERDEAALCEAVATAATVVLGGLPMIATFHPEYAAFVLRPRHHVEPETLH